MEAQQIIRHVDDGANFYLRLFSDAQHMEYVDSGYYCYVKPKDGKQGITFVFDIRLENLPIEAQKEKVAEIKALNMPIWLNLLASNEIYSLVFGKNKEHGKLIDDDDDEAYMALLPALLPEERTDYVTVSPDIKVEKVSTVEEFQLWAKLTNDILNRGFPDMHPVYHYHLCQKGLIKCYICYKNDIPVAVASIFDDNGIASLEFVGTIPEMQRQGLARFICEKAIDDSFENNTKIITVRALNSRAKELYKSLGFKTYNFEL